MCPVSYISECDGTSLNGSHKPWVTTDRKVNIFFARSAWASCILQDKTKDCEAPCLKQTKSCSQWTIKSGFGGSLGTCLPYSSWLTSNWFHRCNIPHAVQTPPLPTTDHGNFLKNKKSWSKFETVFQSTEQSEAQLWSTALLWHEHQHLVTKRERDT